MQFRAGGDELGTQRVVSPRGLLPQAADVLDSALPPWSSEVVIEVACLNIDAASFVQLEATGEPVAAQVGAIVGRAGKMHNPVTGSGGMLLGKVVAVGPDYRGPLQGCAPGTRVATLVSLTLTPLRLERIRAVRAHAHQVEVDGVAFLPSSAPIAVLPDDLPDELTLAVLDVAGAPALVDRLLVEQPELKTLAFIGAGKAGVLAMAAARRRRPDLHLLALDRSQVALDAVRTAGLADAVRAVDAANALEVRAAVHDWNSGRPADAVVNLASLPGTEMGTVLACRQRGTCLFFGMATSFPRVALGAEGVGADVELRIGNGYVTGHADFALALVRAMPPVRALLESRLRG
jgi:L-erythro-3,5-diaminohexanoate dehydrogenase